MDSAVTLRGDKGMLRLEVIDYENSFAKTVEDANWLQVELEVKGGPFSGKFALALTAHELKQLCGELSSATVSLKGIVDFESTEGNLRIRVDFDATGTANVRGVVTPYLAEENTLHFSFRSDPITLEAAVKSLEQLVKCFPARP